MFNFKKLKNLSVFTKIVLVLAFIPMFFAGECSTGPSTGVCYSPTVTIYNDSGETANVSVSGEASVRLYPSEFYTYTLTAGYHTVVATGDPSGHPLADDYSYYACNTDYDFQLLPYIPPAYAELDLVNNTGEALNVWLDGYLMPVLYAGQIGAYDLGGVGYHDVHVEQADSGIVLIDAPHTYFSAGVETWSVDAHYPLVEIHNQLALNDECVESYVDYDLGFHSPVQFDSGFYDVCPAEIDSFSLFEDYHAVDVVGVQDGYFFFTGDLNNDYYENDTTTVFLVQ